MESHVCLEGSNFDLNPLEGKYGEQGNIHHEEVKVIATNRRICHLHISMKFYVIMSNLWIVQVSSQFHMCQWLFPHDMECNYVFPRKS